MAKTDPFRDPAILSKARGLELCDHCLGRQFAQVSTGMSNAERGRALRKLVGGRSPKECPLCGNIFSKLPELSARAAKEMSAFEHSTFLVGTRPTRELVNREEALWEEIGIEHCEPIRSELNREIGKLIEKATGKRVDKDSPDILVIFNLSDSSFRLQVKSLYIYGEYRKLVRGIPQTKWDKYPETVEDIIASPFMPKCKASGHSLHAAGREDIDARCLGWRPFVLELERPRQRSLRLNLLAKAVNSTGKVEVRNLGPSDRKEMVRVKSMRPDKSYRVLVRFSRKTTQKELESLLEIRQVEQETPQRVLHRRADIKRKRSVLSISWSHAGRDVEFEIKGQAGLYIKELVTGDNGRTVPSFSSVLKRGAEVLELDVTRIWA